MEEKCSNYEQKQACIPFFLHESAMMHKDADIERLAQVADGQRRINVIQSIIILAVVVVMVMFYTYRTQIWNNTIAKQNETIMMLLNERTPAGASDGIHKQSDP